MDPKSSRFPVKWIAIVLLVAAGVFLVAYFGPAFFTQGLKIGGTDSAYVMVENRWRLEYLKAKHINIEYESSGSTAGLTNLVDRKYLISFTHAPLDDEQKQKAGGALVQIPVVLCAVVPVYNLKELKGKDAKGTDYPPLNFTGEVLADIFLGKIVKWNDDALKALNPGLPLPDKKIVVVHRSDSSGTTLIFSDYLQATCPAWKEKFGAGSTKIKWPVGEGANRSQELALKVKQTDGAIGYVDLLQARNHQLAYGAVRNREKNFVLAQAENITAALKGHVREIPDDLTYSLVNKGGPNSYPICGTIWAVCYQAQPAASQRLIVDFLQWATHDGQKFAAGMTYAPLPEELLKRVEDKIQTITVSK